MIDSHVKVAWAAEQDEGELNSDDDSGGSSSEGVTTDGDDSNEDDQSEKLHPPSEETPWERGLRLARDRARKAKMLRQADVDLEDKRLYFTVVAPDPSEDNIYADVCDLDRPNPSDNFWLNYHKLAIVGCTQLTCKRSLPCDLSPLSQRVMSRWRKRLHGRARSSDDSACSFASSSNVTSNYGSRSSSLSSLAGSILFAVPDLVIADDSDREGHRRRHRGGDITISRSSSSSGTESRSARHVSSSQNSSHSSKAKQKNQQRKINRGIYSASSSSSASPADVSNALSKSKGRLSGKESGPIVVPRSKDEGCAWWGKRPPIVPYEDQRHPLPPAMPQISGYHHQQSSFSRNACRNGEKDPNYSGRHSFGNSNRWSSDQPPPMPSQRPVKRPWVAEPPKSKGSLTRQPSPPTQPPRSRRSRSRSVLRGSPPKNDKATPATGITSWSQSHSSRHSFSKSNLPEFIPPQTNVPSTSGKRAVSLRRKSRSPFANSYFGNPPAPAEMPFEQSVPLLAGAVNPAAPPPPNSTGATKALPSAAARPGVKLKIAPRIRGGLVLPGSALERAHRGNHYKVNGSPVSSASSGGRSGRSPSPSPSRRGRPGLLSPIAAKRMRHLGYTAVSPGGFESPPPLPSPFVAQNRPYSKGRRFEANQASSRMRNRAPGQDRGDGHHSRAGGDYHDRFSRSGQRHPPPERNRDRRPPPPQPERFDRRGIPDRRALTYDRYRPSREYSSFVHPRAEERDNNRSYDGSRHSGSNRRQGNAARSRSPFEGRAGSGGDYLNSDTIAEQRLNELRRRLTMVDDKIAELGGALVRERR